MIACARALAALLAGAARVLWHAGFAVQGGVLLTMAVIGLIVADEGY